MLSCKGAEAPERGLHPYYQSGVFGWNNPRNSAIRQASKQSFATGQACRTGFGQATQIVTRKRMSSAVQDKIRLNRYAL